MHGVWHVWHWLIEFRGVVELFCAFSFDYFHGSIAHRIELLIPAIV